MNMVKWELEELSFKTLYPEIYEEIDRLVTERAPQREEYLRDVIGQIEEDLRRSGHQGHGQSADPRATTRSTRR